MNTLIYADIFFFISSIGFVVLFGVLFIGALYVVGILKSVRRISQKLENDLENISTETKEFFTDIRESILYRMLFRRSRTSKK